MLNITMLFFLEEVLAFTPLHVGMVMMVVPIVLVIGSPIIGWLMTVLYGNISQLWD